MTKFVIKSPVTSIVTDSRAVVAGSLFLAYPGISVDGRHYIDTAIQKGAAAILWDSKDFSWRPSWKIEHIPIVNLKQQASRIAGQFYGAPSKQLWTIGITGTNGKTSISQWIAQCFNALSRKAAVIGTLGNGLPNALTPSANTTPDSVLLQGMLAQYVLKKVEVVAMEVSSHGLDQGRVNGVHFDVAVLSNLSRDHLDYHGTIEKYENAKRRLFGSDSLKVAVLNEDDAFGKTIKKDLARLRVETMTYGIDAGDVRASKINYEGNGFNFTVSTPYGQAQVNASLLGKFNVYNVLAVLTTLLVSKVSLTEAVEVIASIPPVTGRMQMIGGDHLPLVVVDYAHTPDALENVLLALKLQAKERLICLFGCGGDRDQGKRPLMGEVANRLADAVVVTSDNPRTEGPAAIIQEILEGLDGEYAVEEDRAKAIELAISNAMPGDVVLIAGKGHEEYQEVDGEKRFFSDLEQAQKALKHYEMIST